MGKAVKTVATVALVAAGGYAAMKFGGPALLGGPSNLGHLTRFAAAPGGSLFSVSNALRGAGLAMQIGSRVQARKYQSQQSSLMRQATETQNLANERANKYRQLVQRRSKQQQLRQERIARAGVEAAGTNAGLGVSGTSPVMGSIGAASSQIRANIGNINVAQDVGNQITGLNTMSANYQTGAAQAESNANMWNQMNTLGGTLLGQSDQIASLFGQK